MLEPETRKSVADAIRAHPEAELVDYTRDVYKTMYVTVDGDEARDEVIALATERGYIVRSRAAAGRIVLEAPEGAPEKVRMGGNRLMYPPSNRTRSSTDDGKKSASHQVIDDDGEWSPQQATLRDGVVTEVTGHAQRNLDQLRMAVETGDLDETAYQEAVERVGAETSGATEEDGADE